jgi:hypothetical protein
LLFGRDRGGLKVVFGEGVVGAEYDGLVDGEPSVDFAAEALVDYFGIIDKVVHDFFAQPAACK